MLGPDGTDAPGQLPGHGQTAAKDGAQGRGGAQRGGDAHARTLIGYAEAKSGRPVVLAVMMANIPFRSFAHVDAIVDDDGELAGAIQHAF